MLRLTDLKHVLIRLALGASVVILVANCGGSGGSSTAAHATTAQPFTISPAAFLATFARRTNARVKVSYNAYADGHPYTLIVARDSAEWMHSESASGDGGDFTAGSTDPGPTPHQVKVTRCEHLTTKPVCHTQETGNTLTEDFVSLVAADEIRQASSVGMLGPVKYRDVAGRPAQCVTIDGPKVTRRLNDGSRVFTSTVCIDANTGVMLSWQESPSGSLSESMTATKVESPVPDDFNAPAPST